MNKPPKEQAEEMARKTLLESFDLGSERLDEAKLFESLSLNNQKLIEESSAKDEALIAALAEVKRLHEAYPQLERTAKLIEERDKAKQCRIKYQDICYAACLAVDKALGRSTRPPCNLTPISRLTESIELIQSQLTAANEQIEKLKEWLPYIEHKAYCETGQGPGRECSCGLTVYRESIKGVEKEKRG